MAAKTSNHSKNDRYFKFIPLILIIFQAVYIFHSFGYIRYEDVAESVRNPFWLEHRTIYDGTSSNVGWYGTMLLIYKFAGFHLYAARFYRIALYAVFIFIVAKLLAKYFGPKKSIIPLITIGLSPTLLYLNTFQAAYGLDVQYFIIMVGIILSLSAVNRKYYAGIFFSSALAMWTAMSYPPGLFMLPALGLVYIFKLRTLKLTSKQWLLSFATAIIGFITPFVLMLTYLSDPGRLLHDKVGGQGIFRGSGRVAHNLTQFLSNTQDNLADLFLTGISAQFELPHVEFGGLYPIAAFALVLFLAKSIFFTIPKYRPLIIVSVILILTSFIGTGMSSWGLRTNAPSLIGIYGLYTIAWVTTLQAKDKSLKRKIVLATLLLIPLHHLINFKPSYDFIGQPSKVSYQLAGTSESPEQQLKKYVMTAQNRPVTLSCLNNLNQPIHCRYQEVYAAVTGACLWNHLQCQPVLGYDVRIQQYRQLDTSLWLSYYWAH